MTLIPGILYRFFEKSEHASEFISGEVRFGTLKKYQEVENQSRGDQTEGIGKLCIPGESLAIDMGRRIQNVIPGYEELVVYADPRNHFVFCLSACEEGDLQLLARKFGAYCVVVKDPKAFENDLVRALADDSVFSVNPPMLECKMVRYDKGESLSKQLSHAEKSNLAWCQKPTSYAYQKEFRVHFNFTSHELIGSPEHHTLCTGRSFSYCEMFLIDS